MTLAIALTLAGAQAQALGLGPIQVKSGLNQPLVAEIAVTGGADETGSLSVELASAEDFERVGLSRSRVGTPLEFTIMPGKNGAVIRVTTKEPVRDPFVDFLLEVNWGKGKLLREYTVLLDPPTMAPAIKGSSARVAPIKETTVAAPTEALPANKSSKPPRSIAAPDMPPVSEPTKPSVAEKTPRSPARATEGGEYGPVSAGETLWDIASATRPDGDVSLNQMMVALLRTNPNAFYKDNINTLKRGAILRIPNSSEIKAFGSIAAAAAEVRAQNENWRSGGVVASTPTLIANTGKSTAASRPSAESPTVKSSDRLALVPPKAGSGGQSGADQAGTATNGTGDATLKTELARTKEALASRDQETTELKSRVKALEDIGVKNERLLSLKDSELAELQKKLKELQDKAGKPDAAPPSAVATPSPKPVSTSPTSTAGITKEDIWGGAAASDPAKPATSPSLTNSATVAPAAASTVTSSPNAVTATSGGMAATAPAASTSETSSAPMSSVSTTLPGTAAAPPSSSSTPPPSMSPAAVPASMPSATPSAARAATTTAAVPASKPAKVQPLPVEEPWYRKTWLLVMAGVALLGVVLVAVLNMMRRPKAMPAATGGASFAATGDDEEAQLLRSLARQPDDTAAHLELASLYYARQDIDKFEAAAQAMYAHVGDGSEAEWEQVRAMGRELAPYNPLFAEALAADDTLVASSPLRGEDLSFDSFEAPDVPAATPTSPVASPLVDEAFDFDLPGRDDGASTPAPSSYTPPAAPSFDEEFAVPAAPAPVSPAHHVEEDFGVGGEDAIGTKLDLAKAYLDMGDPEGARSMLEEVLGEGSENQKKEARKLLADIR